MLALAQTAERFGQRPSQLFKIAIDFLALDFDITCSYRLLLADIERQKRELAEMNGDEYDGDLLLDAPRQTGGTKGKITKDTEVW